MDSNKYISIEPVAGGRTVQTEQAEIDPLSGLKGEDFSVGNPDQFFLFKPDLVGLSSDTELWVRDRAKGTGILLEPL